jgi:hypothetical protein
MMISLREDDRAYDNLGNQLNVRAVKQLVNRIVNNPQLGEITELGAESSLSGNGGVTLIQCDRSLWEEIDTEQFFDDIIEEVSLDTSN